MRARKVDKNWRVIFLNGFDSIWCLLKIRTITLWLRWRWSRCVGHVTGWVQASRTQKVASRPPLPCGCNLVIVTIGTPIFHIVKSHPISNKSVFTQFVLWLRGSCCVLACSYGDDLFCICLRGRLTSTVACSKIGSPRRWVHGPKLPTQSWSWKLIFGHFVVLTSTSIPQNMSFQLQFWVESFGQFGPCTFGRDRLILPQATVPEPWGVWF